MAWLDGGCGDGWGRRADLSNLGISVVEELDEL